MRRARRTMMTSHRSAIALAVECRFRACGNDVSNRFRITIDTTSEYPAFSSVLLMGLPMMPKPIKANFHRHSVLFPYQKIIFVLRRQACAARRRRKSPPTATKVAPHLITAGIRLLGSWRAPVTPHGLPCALARAKICWNRLLHVRVRSIGI